MNVNTCNIESIHCIYLYILAQCSHHQQTLISGKKTRYHHPPKKHGFPQLHISISFAAAGAQLVERLRGWHWKVRKLRQSGVNGVGLWGKSRRLQS